MARDAARRARARAARHDASPAGLGRAGPGRLVGVGYGGLRRAAGRDTRGLCGGGLDRVLGGARDLRAVRRRAGAARAGDPVVGPARGRRRRRTRRPRPVPRDDRRRPQRRRTRGEARVGRARDARRACARSMDPRATRSRRRATDRRSRDRRDPGIAYRPVRARGRLARRGARRVRRPAPADRRGRGVGRSADHRRRGRTRAHTARGSSWAPATARARCSGPAHPRARRWPRGGRR